MLRVCVLFVQALICLVDKKTGEKSKTRPRFVKQDQVCIARLRTAGTICLETFKDFPQMGRFTLRDEGQYLARGSVYTACSPTTLLGTRARSCKYLISSVVEVQIKGQEF